MTLTRYRLLRTIRMMAREQPNCRQTDRQTDRQADRKAVDRQTQGEGTRKRGRVMRVGPDQWREQRSINPFMDGRLCCVGRSAAAELMQTHRHWRLCATAVCCVCPHTCSRVLAKLISCIFLIFLASSGEIIDTRGGLEAGMHEQRSCWGGRELERAGEVDTSRDSG